MTTSKNPNPFKSRNPSDRPKEKRPKTEEAPAPGLFDELSLFE